MIIIKSNPLKYTHCICSFKLTVKYINNNYSKSYQPKIKRCFFRATMLIIFLDVL